MLHKYIIYGLIDPRNSELKYIGKSCSGLRRPRRHWGHALQSDKNTKKANWIKKLLRLGLIPEVIVLEIHNSNDELIEAEIDLIAYYRSIGCNLTNIRTGGDGFSSEEAKQIWTKRTEESKQKQTERMLTGAVASNLRQRNNLLLRKPLIATNIHTGEERWYLSASHAAKDGIGSRSAISNCLRPGYKYKTNKCWRYELVSPTRSS